MRRKRRLRAGITDPAARDPEIRINHSAEAYIGRYLSIPRSIGTYPPVPRDGRRNYPVNAHRPAGLLITTNLPVSLGRKQVPHKFSPVYGGDAIMTTKLAQINYTRMCHPAPPSFSYRSQIIFRESYILFVLTSSANPGVYSNLVNRFRWGPPYNYKYLSQTFMREAIQMHRFRVLAFVLFPPQIAFAFRRLRNAKISATIPNLYRCA